MDEGETQTRQDRDAQVASLLSEIERLRAERNDSGSDVADVGKFDSVQLRAIAERAVEQCGGSHLQALFPSLSSKTARVDDRALVSTRLTNVLKRWRGLHWASYLDVTPRDVLERNNCGLRSLGEFLCLAQRAASRPSLDSVVSTLGEGSTSLPGELSLGAGTGQDLRDDLVSAAVMTIAAWGVWERGKSELRGILDLAHEVSDLPDDVAQAALSLQAADLRDWTRAISAHYDVLGRIQEFWGSTPENLRLIAERRLLAVAEPETLEEVSRRIGVTRERVRQLEARLMANLRAQLLRHDSSVGRSALRLRTFLGAAAEIDSLLAPKSILSELQVSPESLVARTLLWLAGPYESRGDWMILRPAKKIIEDTKQILRSLTQTGPRPLTEAEDALVLYGIPLDAVRPWIVSVSSFRIEGDQVVYWGGSLADKAAVLLGIEGGPMTAEQLHERIGGRASVRSLANQLHADPRVKRTGLRHFGLRDWHHDEYTSVAEEIAEEIDRQGGAAALDHLVEYVSTKYGVSGNSVRAYAAGPKFGRDLRGLITRATGTVHRVPMRSPDMTRSVYLRGGRWCCRLRVNGEMLRGSGFPVPTAFADLLGLRPLETREFRLGHGRVVASWVSLQPTIGSIRVYLESLGSAEGDLLFLAPENEVLVPYHVPKHVLATSSGLERLALEVGQAGTADLPAVAVAIGLEPITTAATVTRRLMARGEADLASLLESENPDEPFVLKLDSSRFVEMKWSK